MRDSSSFFGLARGVPDVVRVMNLLARFTKRSGELVFNPEADSVEAVQRLDVPRYGWVARWVKRWGLPEGRVLDLGCWTGGFLATLRTEVNWREVWGVDLDGPWLDVARQIVPKGTFVPIESLLNLRESVVGQFDLVFFLETIEHLPRGSEGQALHAIADVVAPGGSLVLSTPYASVLTPLDPAWILLGHRHYRRTTLQTLLEAAGFVVEEVGYVGNLYEIASDYRFLLNKHLRHRIVSPDSFLRERSVHDIQSTRNLQSTGIYLRARKL
jgi:2-polyprenyl-3-methyl-5-hydroxy-6-metoxy-1,4-benzoquinol methylase